MTELKKKSIKELSCPHRYHYVPCDLCGSNRHEEVYRLRNTWIVKCEQCGHRFVNPRPDTDILLSKLKYWANQDVNDPLRLSEGYTQSSIALYKRYLAWITEKINGPLSEKRLLDIGCGTGGFIHVARNMGADVLGLEIGEPSAQYASNVMKLPVLNISLLDAPIEPKSFDIIVMMDVIEHLESPNKAIQRCHSWLKPGGIIFITTPNFNSLFRRLYGPRWWVINCEDEHIHFFTLDTLDKLIRQNSFITIFRHIRTIDIMGIVKQAMSLTNDSKDETESAYYRDILSRARLKNLLETAGLLDLVKKFSRGIECLFTLRYTPFYEMGQQLVVIGRRI